MTHTKHTPGPWHFTSESTQWHYIHSYENGIVAEVRKRSNTNEEGEANARLIAAAPKMLAALEDACFLLNKCGINWKEAASMADSMKRSATDARAIIAEATGK